MSIAETASGSRSSLATVAVTMTAKSSSPAPRASSAAVAAAARCSFMARAVGRSLTVARKSAARLSRSTTRAARAGSRGRNSIVTRLRSMSAWGLSRPCRTELNTSPRGGAVMPHVVETALSWR